MITMSDYKVAPFSFGGGYYVSRREPKQNIAANNIQYLHKDGTWNHSAGEEGKFYTRAEAEITAQNTKE